MVEIKEKLKKPYLELLQGDITEVVVDSIVCPTTPGFRVAYILGGVANAIFEKCGEKVFTKAEEMARKFNNQVAYPIGHSIATYAEGLKNTEFIIHTVAAKPKNGGLECDEDTVYKATLGALKHTNTLGIGSIAFPAIGTGHYEMDIAPSVRSIQKALEYFSASHPNTSLKTVKIVLYTAGQYNEAVRSLSK